MVEPDEPEALQMLGSFELDGARLTAIPTGHINPTWRVDHRSGRFILQRLHPVFSPEVHHDIEVITARLQRAGLVTPRLVRTREGNLWANDPAGRSWRLFTFVEGETLQVADSAERCREAGRFLGAFHRALWDCDHVFHHGRLGVHDTPRHIEALERALQTQSRHPALAQVEPVARAILRAAAGLRFSGKLPERLVHGDPKLSNLLFDPSGRAVCLVDLDTLGRMPVAVELGDAFRSWCNLQGEEVQAPFDLGFFRAGLEGYAGSVGKLPAAAERDAIPALTETIAVELAARFCTDALCESYFGWDRSRFSRASQHNLVRAQSQLYLAGSIKSQLPEMERIVRSAWRQKKGA